ncbi:MAG: hypothetical protein SNH94_02135 [Rikenellaceae bacterium]
MDNRICENCEHTYDRKLEFCPKCGMYNVELVEPDEQIQQDKNMAENNEHRDNEYKPQKEIPIEQVVRKMANNISTIKSIMVFFTWLWGIGVALWIIILIVNS